MKSKIEKRFINVTESSFFSALSLLLMLFVFLINEVPAQTLEELRLYAARIKFGKVDAKRNALFELRNFESENAARVSLQALQDPSEIVRATAIRSIIYLPENESVNALLPLLQEKSEFIRKEVAYALGEVGNKNASPKLIQSMRTDKKRSVRAVCASALGKIGDISAIKPLISVLMKKPKKKHSFFRRSAARSIGQIAQTIQGQTLITTTPESFLPSKHKKIRKSKYQKLISAFPIFEKANTILLSVLKNRKEFKDVKREASFALGEIGDVSSVNALKANLNSKDYYLVEISKEAINKININLNYSKQGI